MKNTESSKRCLDLKIGYNGITEMSRLVVKTPVITANPFLLEYFRDCFQVCKLMTLPTTIEIQTLKKIDELPHYTDDNLCSQISRLCLPLNLLNSAFDKDCEHSHAGMRNAHCNFNKQ